MSYQLQSFCTKGMGREYKYKLFRRKASLRYFFALYECVTVHTAKIYALHSCMISIIIFDIDCVKQLILISNKYLGLQAHYRK